MMTTARKAPRTTSGIGSLIGYGVAAAVVASIATTIVAALGHAVGISLDMSGAPLPVTGFGVLTAVFSLVGVALAVVLAYTVRNPRRVFVRTTVALTVLSLIPPLIADAGPATKALLVLAHLVAAAIVIPVVARRLAG
jgi:hypothetical protein